MVIQRDNSNQASVQVAGSYAQPLDAVEVRFVARVAGQGTTTNWRLLQANPVNGQFNGIVPVSGGWYQINVRGLKNGQVVATDSLDRFGVGEVFAIVGHSNAQGSSCFVNGVDQCPTMAGATDDRVIAVPFNFPSPEIDQYFNTANPRFLAGLDFRKLQTGATISPFASVPWLWGRMGDLLVQRINVPVLFYNAGFGGTNMEYNYKAAYDIPFDHSFVRYPIRMPWANVRNLMGLYVPATGIRAMLLQHGENDRGNSTTDILTHHYGVIDKSRTEFNKPNLAWIVALSSFVGGPFENVRSAQSQVINRANYRTFQGPDLDNITSLAERPDGIHYSPSGQARAGELWANAITNSMLQSITPYLAQPQPLVSLTCASGNQLTLTQPGGYSEYIWTNGASSSSVSVGTGLYSARLRNAQNQHVFPPAVQVPATVRPATPTITASGSGDICLAAGLSLTSSYTGLNRWNTGAAGSSITVTSAGSYSVQAENEVYGCLSAPASRTVALAGADLSLAMSVSRRTPAMGDTVTYTLTVRNESGCDARSVTLQNRLPGNLSFVSSADGLTAANNIVSGTIPVVAGGQQVSRRYIARLTAAGTYWNAAELTATTNPDPDSQPATGTADGQDDAATADLRTRPGSSSAVFASPNPNQAALPPVQSNQPTPDPTKVDLSLHTSGNVQVVKVGQFITFTLTVRNSGGLSATGIGVQHTLPAGLVFSSSTTGMAANGQLVSGTITSLAPGQFASLSFVARATTAGTLTGMAQISSSGQPDTDSQPGNGAANGEDDANVIVVRITN
ncbi:DUF11 domain-containing protein [Spirosoma montaniterrae]|nr:DUF11 domain-containing protein [Spirosoma montaniterrae]